MNWSPERASKHKALPSKSFLNLLICEPEGPVSKASLSGKSPEVSRSSMPGSIWKGVKARSCEAPFVLSCCYHGHVLCAVESSDLVEVGCGISQSQDLGFLKSEPTSFAVPLRSARHALLCRDHFNQQSLHSI